MSLSVFLIVAATVLSAISVFRSRGQSELPWACLALSLVHLLPLL